MSDTYEFLKAQKDEILAKRESEQFAWIDAATADIKHYRQRAEKAEEELAALRSAQPKAEPVAKDLVRLADIIRDCGRLVSTSGNAERTLRAAAELIAAAPQAKPLPELHKNSGNLGTSQERVQKTGKNEHDQG